MKEERYYTPEIEEFTPWFPFEYYKELPKWKEGQVSGCSRLQVGEHIIVPGERSPWVRSESYQEFDDFDVCGLGEIQSMIRKGAVRIKHLDREDIESLHPIDEWFVNEGEYGGTYMIKLHGLDKITILVKDHIRDGSGDFNIGVVLRRARIKNKSELRKVLSMLGIEN